MKLILKEYLASLRERGDLDKSVLPNLLSEVGLRILSTPMIGTKQNGADIAAVGRIKGEDKQRYLYLFCIKAGDITRQNWSVGEQSVRSELDQVRDVYLRSNVAKEYAQLPVKICLTFGGEIRENVAPDWAGYTDNNETDRISYEEWNGDRLAELMMRCLLARELLDDEPRVNFQKAVAMVNEPDACYDYSRAFLSEILLKEPLSKKAQLLALRQAFICIHAVCAWSIDAHNLESTYKVAELGILYCWNMTRSLMGKKRRTKHEESLLLVLDQFLKLYLTTSKLYFSKTATAHADSLHALSMSVNSREHVDVNLSMFELLGRLALYGVWTDFFSKTLPDAEPEFIESLKNDTSQTLNSLVLLINNNPILNSPIKDDHMIEIALVMYLAQTSKSVRRFLPWLHAISDRTTFALLSNSKYPICTNDYNSLLVHPESNEQSYRDEVCSGSILYPFIYFWLLHSADNEIISEFTERLQQTIPNCTHQTWYPDDDTDDMIWIGQTYHGICVTDISPQKGAENFESILNKSMESCNSISEISAIKSGLIPIFLTACRHYRLPIPPNFWRI